MAMLVVLTSAAIFDIVEMLTDQEAFEVDRYASKQGPERYCERATAWLIAKGKVNL